jgi:hypothetical protein
MHSRKSLLILSVALGCMAGCANVTPAAAQPRTLRSALTFYAPFDGTADAVFAKGDPRFFNAASMRTSASAAHGLPTNTVTRLAAGEGRFGDALRFSSKQAPFVFFRAATNVHYATSNWSGTVSFWLNTDPINELQPGFCDPIQVTPRAWNDAAFFVEFEKREKIPFRLGVYSDFNVWNPDKTEWNKIPFSAKPLVTVDDPPFARGKWTHIVFTWQNFNTGQSNGVPRLYLDGELRGALSPRVQTFTWDIEKSLIGMGIAYVGLFDELSAFDRALSEAEVKELHTLPQGVRSLLR